MSIRSICKLQWREFQMQENRQFISRVVKTLCPDWARGPSGSGAIVENLTHTPYLRRFTLYSTNFHALSRVGLALLCVLTARLHGQDKQPCPVTFCSNPVAGDSAALLRAVTDHIPLAPPSAHLTLSTLEPSEYSGYQRGTLAIDVGSKTRNTPLFVSFDNSFAVFGVLFDVAGGKKASIPVDVRQSFAPYAAGDLTVQGLQLAPLPDLQMWKVVPSDNDVSRNFLTIRGTNILIVGPIIPLDGRYNTAIQRVVSKRRGPSEGASSAEVTIVEYSDLQCPACKGMNLVLEQVSARYPGHVRIIYREFPMTAMHAWALLAARTAQCVFAQRPESYVAFRNSVFEQQASISQDAALKLQALAAQLPLDQQVLSACVSSQGSLQNVEADVLEGSSVGVATTPTIFVNGEEFIGAPSPEVLGARIEANIRPSK
jgi:protein-disulfide isomerase